MHVYLPPNPMSDASDREDDEDSVAVADENSEDRMWCYLFGLGEKSLLVTHIRDGDYAAALKTCSQPPADLIKDIRRTLNIHRMRACLLMMNFAEADAKGLLPQIEGDAMSCGHAWLVATLLIRDQTHARTKVIAQLVDALKLMPQYASTVRDLCHARSSDTEMAMDPSKVVFAEAKPAKPATEATEAADPAEATEATEATEVTEATEATEATEVTEATEATEAAADECCICLNPFDDGDAKVATSWCGHDHVFFHLQCLSKWIETCVCASGYSVCPICRCSLT